MCNHCIWIKYEPFTVVAKLATAKLKMCILILFFSYSIFLQMLKSLFFRFSFCLFRLQKLIMTFFMTLSIIFLRQFILLVNSKAWVTIFRSIVVKCEASKTTIRHRNSNLHHFSTMCILAPPSGGHDHSKLLVWITLAEKNEETKSFYYAMRTFNWRNKCWMIQD